MKPKTIDELPAASIWEHALQFEGSLTPTAARALLKLKFAPADIDRMNELGAKARSGRLSDSEQIEIDTFERLGCVLDILHSKSRKVLGHNKASA